MTNKTRKVNFPINGQGVFIYTAHKKSNFSIYVTPDKLKDDDDDVNWAPTKENEEEYTFETYIVLHVNENSVQFAIRKKNDESENLLTEKYGKEIGVEVAVLVSYWFSYDRDGLILKYGKGHVMKETTHLEHDFLAGMSEEEKKATRKELYPFFNADKKKSVIVKSATSALDAAATLYVTPRFQFRPNPFTCNYCPFVMDSSKVTLFDLDRDEHMFSCSLPSACQELYGNIKSLTLEYPENPVMKLSDAIRYSIETKGMTLYKKIKEKAGEFPYLRVTLGPDQRTAPGIPYVLEIWPSGSKSPVHNHGGACAVIKNLFGRISVNIFNKLKDPPERDPKPIKKFDLKQDQITWIGPNWYQTHRLVNNTGDFCATIQCYRYEESDMIHWPGFDFVEERQDFELEEFYPNSDFTFINIRGIVLKEYQQFLERIVNPVNIE